MTTQQPVFFGSWSGVLEHGPHPTSFTSSHTPSVYNILSMADTPLPDSTDPLQRTLHLHGLERRDDGSITWTRANNDHPRNWTMLRKLYDTGQIICLDLVTLVFPCRYHHSSSSDLLCTSAIGTAGVSITKAYGQIEI